MSQLGDKSSPWQELERHFIRASELSGPAQRDYLHEHVNDDAMRLELADLLASDADPATGIATLISREAKQVNCLALSPGDRVGIYRIVEKIAEGGMGTVFRAERADGEFDQLVAIKLLRQQLPSALAIERFMHERRILAELEHPGIARLLDGGTTKQGLPYLVMELIEGQPIDLYCQKAELPVHQRLELFKQVCSAVQAAHQSLVIHRDIKPSNILVDRHGHARLLDFGIAKLVEADDGTRAVETLFAGGAMTPEYASPEQVRGRRINTTSDVYSLGALLYTLLVGQTPFHAARGDVLGLQKAICEQEPPRPSQTSTAIGTPGNIDSDLDFIVHMAMRKEPESRYRSAQELSEDIDRYLTSQPVRAKRGTLRYHAVKYAQRNRWPLLVASAIIISMVGLASFHTQRLSEERRISIRERDTADEVSRFMVNLFSHANPNQNNPDTTAREILAAGARRVIQQLSTRPVVASRLLLSMGDAHLGLGLYGEAIDLHRRALQMRQSSLAPDDPLLAEAMETLSDSLREVQHWKEALKLVESATAIRQKMTDTDPLPYAKNLVRRVRLQQDLHQTASSMREDLRLALEIMEAHPDTQYAQLAMASLAMSKLHQSRLRLDLAMAWVDRASAMLQQAASERDGRHVALDQQRGALYLQRGDCQASIAAHRRALVQLERYKWYRHPHAAYSYRDLAICQHLLGDYAGAYTHAQLWAEVTADYAHNLHRREWLNAVVQQVVILSDLSHLELAEALLDKAAAKLGQQSPGELTFEYQLNWAWAHVHKARKNYAAAMGEARQALAAAPVYALTSSAELAKVQLFITDLAISMGRMQEARRLIEPAVQAQHQILGEQHPDYALALGLRGRVWQLSGNLAQAQDNFRSAVRLLPPQRRNDLALARIFEAHAHLQNDTEESLALRDRASAIRQGLESVARAVSDKGFVKIPDGAIQGYNLKVTRNISLEGCKELCLSTREFFCKSLDYQKYKNICYLHRYTPNAVGGLKTDYEGNIYDHYTRIGVPDEEAVLPPNANNQWPDQYVRDQYGPSRLSSD